MLNPDWRWAIWYPLRRSGRFAQLTAEEQRTILAEHGAIGKAFGAADYAHDVRLACHGLDRDDNDFVIGLIGKELFPLSASCSRCARPSRPRSTSTASARSSSAAPRGARPESRQLEPSLHSEDTHAT